MAFKPHKTNERNGLQHTKIKMQNDRTYKKQSAYKHYKRIYDRKPNKKPWNISSVLTKFMRIAIEYKTHPYIILTSDIDDHSYF